MSWVPSQTLARLYELIDAADEKANRSVMFSFTGEPFPAFVSTSDLREILNDFPREASTEAAEYARIGENYRVERDRLLRTHASPANDERQDELDAKLVEDIASVRVRMAEKAVEVTNGPGDPSILDLNRTITVVTCSTPNCENKVTRAPNEVRIPIARMDGWYFSNPTGWLCGEHDPEATS